MSKGDFPDSLSRAMLVGTMLVGGLGVVWRRSLREIRRPPKGDPIRCAGSLSSHAPSSPGGVSFLQTLARQCEARPGEGRELGGGGREEARRDKAIGAGRIRKGTSGVNTNGVTANRARLCLSVLQHRNKNPRSLDSLRGSSVKLGKIRRRLAWPLRKDDTHTSRSVNNCLTPLRAKGQERLQSIMDLYYGLWYSNVGTRTRDRWIPFGDHPLSLGTIRRRLAWPLCKDHTHTSRSVNNTNQHNSK